MSTEKTFWHHVILSKRHLTYRHFVYGGYNVLLKLSIMSVINKIDKEMLALTDF